MTENDSRRNQDPIRIGIIGGGPAGLMTALALESYLPSSRAHMKITLLDRNKSETDYPGVEYGIQERACRALEKIGKLDDVMVRSVSHPISELAFNNSRLDKKFRSVETDSRYTHSVARQDFLARLGELLCHTEVRRQHQVEGILINDDESVQVMGSCKDGTEKTSFTETFDLLVAADGIHSMVRKSFFPNHSIIHDRGFSCIYMLVEGTNEKACKNFMQRANGPRVEFNMGSFSTMGLFPLGQGRLAYAIGFDHAIKEKLWSDHGLQEDTTWQDISPSTKKEIARCLARDSGDESLVQSLDLVPNWDSYKIYLWSMHDTDPLPCPYPREKGNIILLGDAAHAILPTIGMGASLAMEDAEVLARLLLEAGHLAQECDAGQYRQNVRNDVLMSFANARTSVWQDLVHRARTAAAMNFVEVGSKTRFAVGPQIPNVVLSRIVSFVERFLW